MMFINSDASRACTMRGAGSRLVHGRRMTGGQMTGGQMIGGQMIGGKGGNLTPARADRLCSSNTGPYSGGKEFPVAGDRTLAMLLRARSNQLEKR
jgi:hypothetical protein